MKSTLSIVLCACLISLCGVTTSRASGYAASVVDVVIVRPAGFAATVVGSAFFVVALPFAAAANGVKETGDALVVDPAKFTFVRPVGDFNSLKDEPTDASSSQLMRGPGLRQVRNSELPSDKASRKKVTNRRKTSLVPTELSPPTRQFADG